jgi:[citrate (pro-3S)-lyase] ligase
MEIRYGSPFRGAALEKLKSFLLEQNLAYEEQVQFSVCIMDEQKIAATGSLDSNVIKCIAVDPVYQNEGLAAQIVTELINKAAVLGLYHLFIFTKPENSELFSSLGFYTIARTEKALLMENKKDGITRFTAGLKAPYLQKNEGRIAGGSNDRLVIGAVVANCNPFTKGHLYLFETAASQCDVLHLFILSENKSEFSAELRRELVVQGTAHIPNVIVQPTGPYLISGATFPEYFLKKTGSISPQEVNGELDLTIFAECIARPMGITRRFVGTEPYCQTTAAYNKQMKEILPRFCIEVVEIPRLEINDDAVSASRVRKLLKTGTAADIEALVPPVTYQYLCKNEKQS